MKTKILLFASIFFTTLSLQAQAPEKLNYQGIARDNTGAPLANQALGIKISILHNSTVDYSETHKVTTNNFGLYILVIGDGTPIFGGMALVDWSAGNKFIKVEIDPNGGTNYTDLGTTELLSVPYALYAAESPEQANANPIGPAGGDLTGAYPDPSIAGSAVGTNELANNAVTAPKIDDMGAATGQVLKWNGTAWAPASDNSGAAYTAGTGISISGSNAISSDLGTDVESSEIVDGTIVSADLANNAVATGKINNLAVTSAKIDNGAVATTKLANNAVTAAKIDPMGATNGQVLKFDGTDWAPANDDPGAAGWELGGNVAGSSDFIGTTNNEALRFKQNDIPAGFIEGDLTAFGKNALSSNTSGIRNSAIGESALYSNTTGSRNAANGYRALYNNTTGEYNTANGAYSLFFNTTGNNNTASGYTALYSNTTGGNNTAIGYSALYSNTTAYGNVAVGYKALNLNTTGEYNTAVGAEALEKNTTGNENTAFGDAALSNNTTGGNNSAFGARTLNNNTTGQDNAAFGGPTLSLNTTGSDNSAFGTSTMYSNTTGSYNSAFGRTSLFQNTTGSWNTAIGHYSLKDNTTGNHNTAIGDEALDIMSGTSSFNTGLGDAVDISDNTNNSTAIGYNADVSGSNKIVLGDVNITSIGGYANWTNLSDARFKKNMAPLQHGLDFILKLEPVTYNMNMQKLHNFMEQREGEAAEDAPKWLPEAMAAKAAIQYSGFSAQQVEQAAQEIGYDFSGVHHPDTAEDHYTLAYAEFVVPLVKAVQEQQKLLQAKEERIQKLEAEVLAQKNLLLDLQEKVQALENQ